MPKDGLSKRLLGISCDREDPRWREATRGRPADRSTAHPGRDRVKQSNAQKSTRTEPWYWWKGMTGVLAWGKEEGMGTEKEKDEEKAEGGW